MYVASLVAAVFRQFTQRYRLEKYICDVACDTRQEREKTTPNLQPMAATRFFAGYIKS